jgi:hypothetical protein
MYLVYLSHREKAFLFHVGIGVVGEGVSEKKGVLNMKNKVHWPIKDIFLLRLPGKMLINLKEKEGILGFL